MTQLTTDQGDRPTGPVAPVPPDDLSLVAVRAWGTVMLTVRGPLDQSGCELLETRLTDLIEDQDNLTVAVDLRRAVMAVERHMLFVIAACRARRRGTRFVLMGPPASTAEALRSDGLGGLVEVVPRRASGLAPRTSEEASV